MHYSRGEKLYYNTRCHSKVLINIHLFIYLCYLFNVLVSACGADVSKSKRAFPPTDHINNSFLEKVNTPRHNLQYVQ